MSELKSDLLQAFEKRSELLEQLHNEATNCYRLFHGTVEGRPGLTIDRYGDQILIQSFHESLSAEQVEEIEDTYRTLMASEPFFVYNDRSERNSRYDNPLSEAQQQRAETPNSCMELGVSYEVIGRHQGQDPLLFLDLRAMRRKVQEISKGQTVLNFFAYTCGIGLASSLAGAADVLNIDFARSNLAHGKVNARLNGIKKKENFYFIESDFFAASRQIARLPVRGGGSKARGRRKFPLPRYPALESKKYDLVILDPPRKAKSPFGTVDLIQDYQSVLKPALMATRLGGRLLITNNVAKVNLEDWLELVKRCGEKCGRPIRNLEVIQPEADFPSFDGNHPLKMVMLEV